MSNWPKLPEGIRVTVQIHGDVREFQGWPEANVRAFMLGVG